MTAISDKHAQLGGATGILGAAVSAEIPAANGGLKQEFQNGTIYWHTRTGAFEVHGAIRARWLALGGEGSAFGYPTSDETATPDGVGRLNNFENASVFWHPSAGAFEVHGLIRARWLAMGGTSSILGYPTTNEQTTPDGIGRYNHFQKGSIYWTPATGAHEVYGAIRARWAELRWERGFLGFPTATPHEDIRNRNTFLVGEFKGGRVEVNLTTQRVLVEKFATTSSPNYSIPVVAYRVSDDDGSRPCAITVDGVQQWVDEANRIYDAAGIRFVYDGVLRDLRDTEVNNVTGEDYPAWQSVKTKLDQLAANHRSIVLVHRAGLGGGFSWWTYDFVAMSFFDSVHLNALSILAHELGHHFGLPHTHARTFQTLREAEDFLLSGGNPGDLDGDGSIINDTPPDPDIVEARENLALDAVTLAGQAFQLARKNIMSYWNHGGMGQLSHGQIDRVRQVVLDRRARYLNVTVITPIDCAALLAEIAAARARLAEVIADRDAEPDPLLRRRYYAAIAHLRYQIRTGTDRARTAGCI